MESVFSMNAYVDLLTWTLFSSPFSFLWNSLGNPLSEKKGTEWEPCPSDLSVQSQLKKVSVQPVLNCTCIFMHKSWEVMRSFLIISLIWHIKCYIWGCHACGYLFNQFYMPQARLEMEQLMVYIWKQLSQ